MQKDNELKEEFFLTLQKMGKKISNHDEKSILNPSFKYTPSSKTDIKETFKRVKKELKIAPKNQDNNKPLVLNPGSFVLSDEWLE
jgi:hypothetical protein